MDPFRLRITGFELKNRKRKPIRERKGKAFCFTRTVFPGAQAAAAEIEQAARLTLRISETQQCVWELAGTGDSVCVGDILQAYQRSCVEGGPLFPYDRAADRDLPLEVIAYPPTEGELASCSSGSTAQTQRKAGKDGKKVTWQEVAKTCGNTFCAGDPDTGRKYLPQDNKGLPEGATLLFWRPGLDQAVARTQLWMKQLGLEPVSKQTIISILLQ